MTYVVYIETHILWGCGRACPTCAVWHFDSSVLSRLNDGAGNVAVFVREVTFGDYRLVDPNELDPGISMHNAVLGCTKVRVASIVRTCVTMNPCSEC